MMKRWISVAMALLMTVTLAACGQTGNETASPSTPLESESPLLLRHQRQKVFHPRPQSPPLYPPRRTQAYHPMETCW